MNFSLRIAVDAAKAANMPQSNVERAVKRGTGELGDGGTIEKAVYGGYGPEGVALAIDVVTDNKNRTVSELRKLLQDNGGTFADADSVLWQFHEKGLVLVSCATVAKAEKFGGGDTNVATDPDEVMMQVIDIDGVEDISCEDTDEDSFTLCEVLTSVKDLARVKGEIDQLGYIVRSAEIIKVPERTQTVDKNVSDKVTSLVEAIEDHDDVENVWTTMSRES